MVRWVVGSILHGVDPLSYFSFQPVLHDCNKGRGMYYHVCGMMHIKEPLLLIGKSSPCGGSGFHLSLSEWSFTICPTKFKTHYVAQQFYLLADRPNCAKTSSIQMRTYFLIFWLNPTGHSKFHNTSNQPPPVIIWAFITAKIWSRYLPSACYRFRSDCL